MSLRATIAPAKPAISSIGKSTFQPKLKVGPTDDAYEREADRVADQVMRMPASESATVQRTCAECEEEERVQRKENGAQSGTSVAPPVVHDVLSGNGRPLDSSLRSFMEPRFGHSFQGVRVHTDNRAAESARSVNALAYTVGRDVVFNSGAYQPGTESGRRLIAHELTHVVQQGDGSATALQRTDWGPLGGKCCNESPEGDEWALVGGGTWQRLPRGECTGSWTDSDGMTCGGAFYKVSNLEGGVCRTPRQDHEVFRRRRWTPNNPNLPPEAVSPTQRGSQEGDTPPGYVYDSQ